MNALLSKKGVREINFGKPQEEVLGPVFKDQAVMVMVSRLGTLVHV